MKKAYLIIFLFFPSLTFAQYNIDSLQGSWIFETSTPLDLTSERLEKRIELQIDKDSIKWNLSETEVIGWVVDKKGNYAGPETYGKIEKGLGKVIKKKQGNFLVLNLQIEQISFYGSTNYEKQYTLEVKNDELILTGIENDEQIILKQYITTNKLN